MTAKIGARAQSAAGLGPGHRVVHCLNYQLWMGGYTDHATLEETGATAIFGETTQPSALAEAVAAELGSTVEVVSIFTGSLGEPGSSADTLIGMLTTNAELIAAAL